MRGYEGRPDTQERRAAILWLLGDSAQLAATSTAAARAASARAADPDADPADAELDRADAIRHARHARQMRADVRKAGRMLAELDRAT